MTVSDRWFLHPDANSRQSRSKCGEAGGAMPGMPGIVVATFWWLACLSSIDEVIGEAQAEAIAASGFNGPELRALAETEIACAGRISVSPHSRANRQSASGNHRSTVTPGVPSGTSPFAISVTSRGVPFHVAERQKYASASLPVGSSAGYLHPCDQAAAG